MEGRKMKDYIKEYCQKCIYYKNRCFYDYGDSLTKIPCEALRRIKKNPPKTPKRRGKNEISNPCLAYIKFSNENHCHFNFLEFGSF